MGLGKQPTIQGSHEELGTMIGEALAAVGDAAYGNWVNVRADMQFRNGIFYGDQALVVGSAMSNDPGVIATSKTEMRAGNYSRGALHSCLSVNVRDDNYSTVSELAQNEAGGVKKITRRLPRGESKSTLPEENTEKASNSAVVDMVREAMGYAGPLPQPRPRWEQEDPGSYDNTGLFLASSERVTPLYAKLLSMAGRAIAEFDSRADPGSGRSTHLSIEMRVDFNSRGRIHGHFRDGQGVKIYAHNSERCQAATFVLRLKPAAIIHGIEHCFVEECSLLTDDRSGNPRLVLTKDLLVPRHQEIGVLRKQKVLPGNTVTTTDKERVSGYERALQMASTVFGLVTTPLSSNL